MGINTPDPGFNGFGFLGMFSRRSNVIPFLTASRGRGSAFAASLAHLAGCGAGCRDHRPLTGFACQADTRDLRPMPDTSLTRRASGLILVMACSIWHSRSDPTRVHGDGRGRLWPGGGVPVIQPENNGQSPWRQTEFVARPAPARQWPARWAFTFIRSNPVGLSLFWTAAGTAGMRLLTRRTGLARFHCGSWPSHWPDSRICRFFPCDATGL